MHPNPIQLMSLYKIWKQGDTWDRLTQRKISCEDTRKKGAICKPGEKPQKKLNMLTSRPWTSSLQVVRNKLLLLSHPVCVTLWQS